MRVVETSPDRLILEIRPVALMIMCVGLFLLFLVLGFGWPVILPILLRGFAADVPGMAGLDMPGMQLLGYASVIPLLVAVVLLKTRRLTLDRATGKVILAARGIFGLSEETWPLAELRGAYLQRNRRAGNNSTTYTPVLEFAGKTVPVLPYGTSGSGPARVVEAVNGWLVQMGS